MEDLPPDLLEDVRGRGRPLWNAEPFQVGAPAAPDAASGFDGSRRAGQRHVAGAV